MRKPRYMEELLKIIFLWLGAAFFVMGLLCFIGVLKPKASSMIQESTVVGIVFLSLGIVFFIVQFILKVIVSMKDQRHNELLISGTKMIGTVEKVYLQKYTHYGSESPYRICYTYSFQEKLYRRKSCLLWDKPDFKEHDTIVVYVDHSGKSTVQL